MYAGIIWQGENPIELINGTIFDTREEPEYLVNYFNQMVPHSPEFKAILREFTKKDESREIAVQNARPI